MRTKSIREKNDCLFNCVITLAAQCQLYVLEVIQLWFVAYSFDSYYTNNIPNNVVIRDVLEWAPIISRINDLVNIEKIDWLTRLLLSRICIVNFRSFAQQVRWSTSDSWITQHECKQFNIFYVPSNAEKSCSHHILLALKRQLLQKNI